MRKLLATEIGWPLRVDPMVEGIELDVDVISDGVDWCVPGILEQLDPPGIHSGDSVAVLPPQRSRGRQEAAAEAAGRIALALGVRGILNVQMIAAEAVVAIEANPRASRTVPIVAKATGRDVVAAAVRCRWGRPRGGRVAAGPRAGCAAGRGQAPIGSLWRLAGRGATVRSRMRSTGEVLGLAPDYATAGTTCRPRRRTSSPKSEQCPRPDGGSAHEERPSRLRYRGSRTATAPSLRRQASTRISDGMDHGCHRRPELPSALVQIPWVPGQPLCGLNDAFAANTSKLRAGFARFSARRRAAPALRPGAAEASCGRRR